MDKTRPYQGLVDLFLLWLPFSAASPPSSLCLPLSPLVSAYTTTTSSNTCAHALPFVSKILSFPLQHGTYQFHHDAWSSISGKAKNFIKRLLVRNPQERMSAAEVRSIFLFGIIRPVRRGTAADNVCFDPRCRLCCLLPPIHPP